jgi:hypothetical protein
VVRQRSLQWLPSERVCGRPLDACDLAREPTTSQATVFEASQEPVTELQDLLTHRIIVSLLNLLKSSPKLLKRLPEPKKVDHVTIAHVQHLHKRRRARSRRHWNEEVVRILLRVPGESGIVQMHRRSAKNVIYVVYAEDDAMWLARTPIFQNVSEREHL